MDPQPLVDKSDLNNDILLQGGLDMTKQDEQVERYLIERAIQRDDG